MRKKIKSTDYGNPLNEYIECHRSWDWSSAHTAIGFAALLS